jgi:ATP-dependent Zn protease
MIKQSFFIVYIYLIGLIFSNSTFSRENHFNRNVDPVDQIVIFSEADQELLESCLLNLTTQFQNIIFCIQQTELTVNQKKIKLNRSQAVALKKELEIIKQILQSVYQEIFNSTTPQDINRANNIIRSITLHLKTVFLDIKTLSAEKIINIITASIEQTNKNKPNDLNLQKLEKRIKISKKHIEQLLKQAETLGLTPWNLRWRKFSESKWIGYAQKATIYGLLGAAVWTLCIVSLPQNTKVPGTSWIVENIWRPFGLWKDNFSNQFNRRKALDDAQMQQSLLSSIAQSHLVLQDPNLEIDKKLFHENAMQENMNKIDQLTSNVSFSFGVAEAMSHFIPSAALLVGLCSPLLVYPQAVIEKVKKIFDVAQDYRDLEQWVVKKYTEYIKNLRGDTNYRYVGEDQNQSGFEGEDVLLEDIVGGEMLKEIALELIDHIKNPKKYEQAGVRAEAAILLHGPPQTGKTMFARALKTELERQIPGEKICFLPVSNYELEHFSIEEIFMIAHSYAPCIVFFDEIDMVGASRNSPNPARTRELLTSLSKAMEARSSKKVFVIGATNKAESLDFALLVKGRFGIEIPLEYPTYKNRLTFLNRELNKRGVRNLSQEFIDNLARETEGKTYNDLSSIISDAFSRSMRELRMVTQNDFEIGFDKQLRGIMPMNSLTEEELSIISTYQIGIGLMRTILQTKNKVSCATICPVKAYIKHTESTLSFTETNNNKNTNTRLLKTDNRSLTTNGFVFSTEIGSATTFLSDQEIKHEILVLLAGQAALKLILGNYYSEYMKDHNAKCLHMIKNAISKGEENTETIVKAALIKKAEYEQEALELLAPYTESIKKLAAYLVEKQTIRAEEWAALVAEIFCSKETALLEDNDETEIDKIIE